MDAIWSTYGMGFVCVMVMLTSVWAVSVRLTNAGIVDPFWGLGFVLVAICYFLNGIGDDIRKSVVLVLCAVWGLRLFGYLFWRNWGKPEDYRYQQFRNQFGAHRYWWFSFFQVFLLQGVLLWLISAPLLLVQFSPQPWNLIDVIACIVWLIGFLFEALGDYQLMKFKSNESNKGKLLTSGVWKYTRHPNYFGDACVWWSFGLFSVAAGSYWPILSSVLMTWLLLKVSGVALLEQALKKQKPGYEDYMNNTPAFFPWFPKTSRK